MIGRRVLPWVAGALLMVAVAASWFVLKPSSSAAPPHGERRDRAGVAIAAVGGGPVHVSGTLREGRAWSAIKVPLAAAFLDARAKAARASDGAPTVTARERRWLRRALTRSDNEAASRLFWRMAGGHAHAARGRARLGAMLGRAGVGDVDTKVQFGTTVWRLQDAVRFYQRLAAGCLLGGRDTRYLLAAMRDVEESERWGIPAVLNTSTPVRFKGGWGPGDDSRWLVEQIAIVGRGDDAKVVGVMAQSAHRARSMTDPSAFEAGTRIVKRKAAQVVRRPVAASGDAAPCG